MSDKYAEHDALWHASRAESQAPPPPAPPAPPTSPAQSARTPIWIPPPTETVNSQHEADDLAESLLDEFAGEILAEFPPGSAEAAAGKKVAKAILASLLRSSVRIQIGQTTLHARVLPTTRAP